MAKIPARFDKVPAGFHGFDVAAHGGEMENTVNLSALVTSFLEREIGEERAADDWDEFSGGGHVVKSNNDAEELLTSLFRENHDVVRRRIEAEVERAVAEIGGKSNLPNFNHLLVALLRGRGFDAGICKSTCHNNGRRHYRDYQYVDVFANRNRYMVEVSLAGEFTIARPTDSYVALLKTLPPIFVGKPDELRWVVKTMCAAIRRSMKSVGMAVPPWRRLASVQSKWFGNHERNADDKIGGDTAPEYYRNPDFRTPKNGRPLYCGCEFAPTAGGRRGNLSEILLKLYRENEIWSRRSTNRRGKSLCQK